MTYWGAGHYGIERCPTCGDTMLNGICYNTKAHGGAGTYVSPNSPTGELGMAIGKLVRKWWDKRQANKKKEELDNISSDYEYNAYAEDDRPTLPAGYSTNRYVEDDEDDEDDRPTLPAGYSTNRYGKTKR
jgi:hypothetical protein